jgi:hypothetical protein
MSRFRTWTLISLAVWGHGFASGFGRRATGGSMLGLAARRFPKVDKATVGLYRVVYASQSMPDLDVLQCFATP